MRKLTSLISVSILLCCLSVKAVERSVYLDLIQQAVEAYTPDQLDNYITEVEEKGIWEHGFARLTSNMGVLIAHGRLQDRRATFEHMMDLCAADIPVALQQYREARKRDKSLSGGVGNDFAVKEICLCINEIEKFGAFPKEKTEQWRNALKDMRAEDIYTNQPKPGDPSAHNWCVFGSASECARLAYGIGGDRAYADKYIADQLRFFDENGMYMDPNQPIVYNVVTKLQFMAALYFGYDGPARAALEEQLLKSAEYELKMQSATGEIPYGGRSNQFLHNETAYAAMCEFYATWMKERGDMAMASRFKAAAERAVASLDYWTNQPQVRHIKNRYPTDSGYGCENYAYFNKYMVTMGSWAILAYCFADDAIPASARREPASTFVTSERFHRIVMNADGYTVQFDTNAQRIYDSSGIGRIQRAGAPPVLALACPCPADKGHVKLDVKHRGQLAISPLWKKYIIKEAKVRKVVLTDGGDAQWTTTLSRKGVKMTVRQKGDIVFTVPALVFDGESSPSVECTAHTLSISFNGWTCEYTTDGTFVDTEKIYGSRNGHLKRFEARSTDKLVVKCKIFKNI